MRIEIILHITLKVLGGEAGVEFTWESGICRMTLPSFANNF